MYTGLEIALFHVDNGLIKGWICQNRPVSISVLRAKRLPRIVIYM